MFMDLTDVGKNQAPKEQQEIARQKFPALVRSSSSLTLYEGDLCSLDCMIIGVATYSNDDMKLLDGIEEKQLLKNGEKINIYVYDVTNAKNMDDINSVFKGIGNVYQTPILARYKESQCQFSASGFEARTKLEELFSLN